MAYGRQTVFEFFNVDRPVTIRDYRRQLDEGGYDNCVVSDKQGCDYDGDCRWIRVSSRESSADLPSLTSQRSRDRP